MDIIFNPGVMWLVGIIAFAVFLLWLSRSIRKDTASKSTLGDEVATMGYGRSMVEGLQMAKTGISRATLVGYLLFCLLLGAGGVFFITTASLAGMLLGGGIIGIATAGVLFFGASFLYGTREGGRVRLVTKDQLSRPALLLGLSVFFAGLVLAVNGVILDQMEQESISAWQSIAQFVVPVVLLVWWVRSYLYRHRPDLLPQEHDKK